LLFCCFYFFSFAIHSLHLAGVVWRLFEREILELSILFMNYLFIYFHNVILYIFVF